jgi:hypothetical protein
MMVFDLLMVGIEASVALAGFSGIIATFQMGSEGGARRGPVASLTVVVEFSLLSALTCTLPLFLHTLGIAGPALWTVSSLIGAGFTGYGAYGGFRNMRGALTTRSITLLFALLQLVGAMVIAANLLNVANVVFHREPGPVIAVVLYALTVAGYVFSRLLLLPLWKAVKEHEDQNSAANSSPSPLSTAGPSSTVA